MKFWDTSAIIPLLVEESTSFQVETIFRGDSSMLVWWGTSIECVSAISRLERENKLSADEITAIFSRLDQLRMTWREIQAGRKVKQIAERILRLHPLRAQDAQQLAACILANEDQSIDFVTLDTRLAISAHKEGLPMIKSPAKSVSCP